MTRVSLDDDRSNADTNFLSANEHFRRFVAGARTANAAESVDKLLLDATVGLGFDYYALVGHGSLADHRQPVMTNYPAGWRQRFEKERFDLLDPVQQACRRRVSGFCWSELKDIIILTPAQERLLTASRSHGLGEGFTVPLHLPGARQASCSFAMAPGRPLPAQSLAAAQVVALAAYERLVELREVDRISPINLSPRQQACVALIAAGLTDGEAGRKLGLSEETVTKYLNAARRRNGLRRRAQLVTAALRDGMIDYAVLDTDSLGHIERGPPVR